MAKETLKLLAQKAKMRLSTAGQNLEKSTNKSTFACLSQERYLIVANRQKIEEDPLFEKVKKILEKDETSHPLAELTDYSIFNSLSQSEKEMYILDISKRYNKIKEYFKNHT